MVTLKGFVPLSKRSSSTFSRKISIYLLPDAAFFKISGAKVEEEMIYKLLDQT